jgi:hypothetical protein
MLMAIVALRDSFLNYHKLSSKNDGSAIPKHVIRCHPSNFLPIRNFVVRQLQLCVFAEKLLKLVVIPKHFHCFPTNSV